MRAWMIAVGTLHVVVVGLLTVAIVSAAPFHGTAVDVAHRQLD